MNKTPIQWTDFTVNPFRFRNLATGKIGHHCAKISPGCKNCYSGKMQTGPYLSGLAFIEENKPKGEFFLDENALQQVLSRKKPARIFWCDMTDMFLEDYPDEWIDRCFAVMALTPHLTHQVLTKRAGRMREYLVSSKARLSYGPPVVMGRQDAIRNAVLAIWPSDDSRRANALLTASGSWEAGALPLANVWLGVSVEDQQRADERIPELLATPAAVRFLSVEPLLGPVGIERWLPSPCYSSGKAAARGFDGIDWVIVGGESGPSARPMDIAWVRSIVQQCAAAGVACFVKQLGAFCVGSSKDWIDHKIVGPVATGNGLETRARIILGDPKGGDPDEWPEDLRVRQMPEVRA